MDYIRQHSSFPVADEYSSGSKAVRMEFYINANHRPERIKVMASSGSKKHDDEAIKLLKEGPNWVCDDDVYPCQKDFIIFFK